MIGPSLLYCSFQRRSQVYSRRRHPLADISASWSVMICTSLEIIQILFVSLYDLSHFVFPDSHLAQHQITCRSQEVLGNQHPNLFHL